MELDIDDKHLCVLSGMSAAMGCLFPTPVTGVLMIHELGNPPKSFMESTLLLSIPAICSFLVFYAIEDYTWIDKIDANYQLSSKWNFEMWHCGAAVLIGMSSAVIAMTSLVGKSIFYYYCLNEPRELRVFLVYNLKN